MCFFARTCVVVVSGRYCDREGLPSPAENCQVGYYCPPGQVTATPGNYTCPQGYFCLEGVGDPAPCPAGKYQVGIPGSIFTAIPWLESFSQGLILHSGVILSQVLFSVRRYSQSFVNLISTPTCSATWCLSVKQAPVSPFILNKLCECTEYHYWLSNIGCLGYRTPWGCLNVKYVLPATTATPPMGQSCTTAVIFAQKVTTARTAPSIRTSIRVLGVHSTTAQVRGHKWRKEAPHWVITLTNGQSQYKLILVFF